MAWRYAPPTPKPRTAAAAEFSAARAWQTLVRLLGDGAPHVTGSAANRRTRARLLGELRRLGLEPALDRRVSCFRQRCAEVVNVLARVPGRDPRLPAILLATHYDSVAAGPGAADDGAGVAAALEVARALRAGPALPRDLLLLFDEGEEQALLGAAAFVEHQLGRHPWARRVGAVVNLEARGTAGPSLLFELSPGNARLVGAAARALPRPATNSIYYTIYRTLPNDTDLTVLKDHLPGVNFAFIGGPLRYHTPRDDLRHLDPGTLQHQGDNALAMVRELATSAGDWQAASDVVFFDLLTLVVVRWPEGLTPVLALATLALVVLGGRRLGRPGRRGLAWAVVGALAPLLAAAGLAWGVLALLRRLGAFPYQWIAAARPLEAVFWGVALLACGAVTGLLGRRVGPGAAWQATLGLWALAALALSFLAPALSYPFLLPAMVGGLVALLWGGPPARTPWLALPPTVLAALLLFPFAWLLFTAMGVPALLGVAVLVALVLTGLAPALAAGGTDAGWILAVSGLIGVTAGAGATLVRPPFTADEPQPLAVVELHDPSRRVHQFLAPTGSGPLPEAWWDWSFAPRPVHPYPWSPSYQALAAPAPPPGPLPPELLVEWVRRSGDELRVRARLRSPRGAPWAGLLVRAGRWRSAYLDGVEALRLDGADGGERRAGGDREWLGIEHATLPAGGAVLELRFAGTGPVEAWLWDSSPGLGVDGGALLRARPDWVVPIHRGDRTMVIRRLVLHPAAALAAS